MRCLLYHSPPAPPLPTSPAASPPLSYLWPPPAQTSRASCALGRFSLGIVLIPGGAAPQRRLALPQHLQGAKEGAAPQRRLALPQHLQGAEGEPPAG